MNAEPVEAALAARGRRRVVLEDGEVTDDLIGDLVEAATSFCAAVRSAVGAQLRGEDPARSGDVG
jgi:putative resolvase